MKTRRVLWAAALISVGVAGGLVAVALNPHGPGWLRVPTGQDDASWTVPASDGVSVHADPAQAPPESADLLRAGDYAGGSVAYLQFEVPEPPGRGGDRPTGAPAPFVQVSLPLSVQGEPPDMVEIVSVPDTGWAASELTWEEAPLLGPVAHSVYPSGGDAPEFDLTGLVTGPGSYAFAVTVPPDRGHVAFQTGEDLALRIQQGRLGTPAPSPSGSVTPQPRLAGNVAASGQVTPDPMPTVSWPPAPTATPTPTASAPPPTVTPAPPSPTVTPAPPSPTPPSPEPPECTVDERLVPSCGALWGVAPGGHTDTPRTTALERFERDTGRRQDIYHAYHRAQAMFPTPEEVEIAADGRVLFLNWKPLRWSWGQIADGHPVVDAYLDRLAAHIRSTYTDPFFFTVHHEPENDVRPQPGSGWEATDYAAMFRYVVQRLREAGVDNLVTVVNYMAYVPWNTQSWFQDMYPGDDVVDWIGWNAYAYSDPGYGHGDFAEMVNRRSGEHPSWPGFYAWTAQQFPDKPMMLGEWGVWHSGANPGHMARFYESAARQVPQFPRLKALVYFDTPADQRGRDSRPVRTEDGLAAYQRLGTQRFFESALVPD